MSDLLKLVEQEYQEARSNHPDFNAGDTINVHVKIKEDWRDDEGMLKRFGYEQ